MKKFTKEEVIQLVKEEMIKTFGGLLTDKKGRPLNLPYTIIGVIHAALPDNK